ncbi:MAG: hypothetical protein J6T56_06955 [Bacteroidales bacterium]|nr:hypothetical protein [Bacteroidales bacterium]
MIFFTACSPDQAVKNYYRSYLTGDYVRAQHYVSVSQREAFSLFAGQLRPDDKKRLRQRRVRVRDVVVDRLNDTAAVATCVVLLREPSQPKDTLYRLALLKKEGRRWRIGSGVWTEM